MTFPLVFFASLFCVLFVGLMALYNVCGVPPCQTTPWGNAYTGTQHVKGRVNGKETVLTIKCWHGNVIGVTP